MKSNWKKVKLSDICDVRDGTHDSPKRTAEGRFLITSKHIKGGKIDLSSAYKISLKDFDMVNQRSKVDQWDILLSMIGTIGEVCIVKEEPDFAIKNVGLIKTNDEILSLYLYYYLKTPTAQSDILARLKGTTQQYLSLGEIRSFPISIPQDDRVMRKITKILSSIDDKIELNNKINRNLEAQAQAIFKSWFIDFEPFKNGKFIDSELGKIPEGWVCKKLKDFVEIKRGSSPRPIQDYLSGSGYNWLKISDATSESSPFIFNIKEHIKKSGISQTVYLVAGELVLSNSATPGIPKFLDVNTCIHDGWLWFSNSKLSYEFLYLFFLHKRRDFISLGNGSVFTNLKTDIVKDALFVYPNKAVMDEFDKITKTIFENIKIRSRESQRLTQLRDALLPKLMSGELTISDYIV